ncbi:centromere protein T [Micropterus salmoides]|uniref:centromere protein T n=1 Tax=Micropterus salmoides TaxID=27706 RepID=UPI0018EBE125|nr:centromere protein T [Micropterus salmoides]
MDPTEDLSARVLLKHILSTDTPRTPITRSASNAPSTSATRRSSRLSKKDAGPKTPKDILRRSLKHKLHENLTRKSLPNTKRRTASVVLRKINMPTPGSLPFDDGDTPRHILMNIMRTEPVRSPVVHEEAASEEPQPSSASSGITSKRPSIELSGLDLPDITIGTAASTVKGLSRKRPRRSLNVTAFEKRLKDGNDVEEENESTSDLTSLSLSSSTSLSLKTPFVDVQTERNGLQRRISKRRKITEEEFGAAVDKRQMGGVSSFVLAERGLSETAYSEGFTLGLSKLSEPDITTDIVHCNTALYAHADAMSNFSIVATQDKPTVMASQLQRQIREMEQEEQEEQMGAEPGKGKSMYLFPTEEEAEPQNEEGFYQSEEDVNAADVQPEDAAAMSKSEEDKGTDESQTSVRDDTAKSEEEENQVEAQTEEDAAASSQSEEEEIATDSQTEEEEEGGVDSQPEEDVAGKSTSEEEEVAPDSQTEEEAAAVDSQSKEDVAAKSLSEEEEDVEEYQSDQEDEANSQSEEEHDGEPVEEDTDQKSEQLQRDLERITRRTHCSEGGLIVPVTDAGWSDGRSKAHSAIGLHSSLAMGSYESGLPPVGVPDSAESPTQIQTDASYTEAEPDANKKNSLQGMPDIEYSGHMSDNSPEEAAADDPAEQEEEWEDDEDGDDIPSKTPAFVREKMKIFHSDPQASPSVFRNTQASSTSEGLPATKPKQVRKRRSGPAKNEGGLPKSYLMGVFKHFAKTKVSADVYPVLKETMDKFFERLADDLETYAVHAKRKTIEVEDAELLLKRQGYVNDKVPVEVLIEKYLRMDQRKLLIPIATSGNVVIPKKRR